MKWILLTIFFSILSACSDNEKKELSLLPPGAVDKTADSVGLPLPSGPERQETISSYCPESRFEWSGGKLCYYDILKADVSAADDYFKWFEATYENWDKSLIVGHSPKIYLSHFPKAPYEIEYIDKTDGSVLGIEKLKAVFPDMIKRCPSLSEERFKAPLQVHWHDRHQVGTAGAFQAVKTQLNDNSNGTFLPAAPLLWASWIEIKGEYVKPENSETGWYGYQFPKQTFLEQTNGQTWAEGATSLKSLDEVFSHEYGHFLGQAWALNSGRSPIQSFMFSEFLAELFKTLCWGGLLDNPNHVKNLIENGKDSIDPRPFGNHEDRFKNVSRRWAETNYGLYSIEKLIAWEKHKGRFDADMMFRAIFDTMEAMTGRIIKDYPAYSAYDGKLIQQLLPWSRTIDNKAIIESAPIMFTRQEFLEKFCDHYPCGELKFLIEADAEGNRKSEW